MSTQAGMDEKFLRRLRDDIFTDTDKIDKNTAIMMACEFAEYRFNRFKNLSATFYMLNELVYPFHILGGSWKLESLIISNGSMGNFWNKKTLFIVALKHHFQSKKTILDF
jgi:hypothetical protein